MARLANPAGDDVCVGFMSAGIFASAVAGQLADYGVIAFPAHRVDDANAPSVALAQSGIFAF